MYKYNVKRVLPVIQMKFYILKRPHIQITKGKFMKSWFEGKNWPTNLWSVSCWITWGSKSALPPSCAALLSELWQSIWEHLETNTLHRNSWASNVGSVVHIPELMKLDWKCWQCVTFSHQTRAFLGFIIVMYNLLENFYIELHQ